MMFNISEFSTHLRMNRPVPVSVAPIVEPVTSQAKWKVTAESPDRDEIVLAAERVRAGCWMFSTVIFFLVICCVLIGNSLAGPANIIPTATASAGTSIQIPTIPTLVVGDIKLSIPLPAPGESIDIWVNVDRPTDVEITYQWTHPEGQGEILDGQGTNSIRYRTPTESGTYKIGVEVTAAGVVCKRTRFITTVGNANGR